MDVVVDSGTQIWGDSPYSARFYQGRYIQGQIAVGQDSKPVECKGSGHLDDGQILGMAFYVKGIDDKLPGK